MFSPKARLEVVLNRLRQLLTLGGDMRTWSLSWAAWQSRRFGSRAILAVGVAATAYAGYLWVTHKIAPDAPKPSHDVILKTRWSSPPPSSQIVILDIDERSLAALSAKHEGRCLVRQDSASRSSFSNEFCSSSICRRD